MERKSVQKVIHAEAFNKVCEALNKVYDAQRNDWDLRVPTVLWVYRKTCKKPTGQTPLRLEYGVNVVVPVESNILSLCITVPIDMMAC